MKKILPAILSAVVALGCVLPAMAAPEPMLIAPPPDTGEQSEISVSITSDGKGNLTVMPGEIDIKLSGKDAPIDIYVDEFGVVTLSWKDESGVTRTKKLGQVAVAAGLHFDGPFGDIIVTCKADVSFSVMEGSTIKKIKHYGMGYWKIGGSIENYESFSSGPVHVYGKGRIGTGLRYSGLAEWSISNGGEIGTMYVHVPNKISGKRHIGEIRRFPLPDVFGDDGRVVVHTPWDDYPVWSLR